MRNLTPERVRRVWCNRKFATFEVAAILRVSESELRRMAALYRLPRRHFVQRNHEANDEPDEAEKAAQEARKAELRAAHIRERINEPVASTQSKVSKWRHGICEPRNAGHVA